MKTFCFAELDETAKKNALLGIRRTLSYKVKMMWMIQQEIEQYFSAMNPCINFYVEKHMNVFSQKVELLLSHEMEGHDIRDLVAEVLRGKDFSTDIYQNISNIEFYIRWGKVSGVEKIATKIEKKPDCDADQITQFDELLRNWLTQLAEKLVDVLVDDFFSIHEKDILEEIVSKMLFDKKGNIISKDCFVDYPKTK